MAKNIFDYGFNDFDSLPSGEELSSEIVDYNYGHNFSKIFNNTIDLPTIHLINPNLSNLKSKLSPKFETFNIFSPKLIKSEDIIVKPKRPRKKILFLSRKKNRKEMIDNILKKIKSRFFKTMKKQLKERLIKGYNYKKNFNFLSQDFIRDVSKKNNKLIWNQTFLEFMKDKSKDNLNKDIILKALQEDKIGNMTLEEIFNEYLNSREFVNSIPNEKNEKELNQKYIDDYIFYANNFINYFTH